MLFNCQIVFHWLEVPHLLNLHGCKDCFQFLTIVNKDDVIMDQSVNGPVFISLEQTPQV